MLKQKSLGVMLLLAVIWLMACSSQQTSTSSVQGLRSGPEGATSVPATEPASSANVGEAILVMDIFSTDPENRYSSKETGEIPFMISADAHPPQGQKIRVTGEGKLIYEFWRPVSSCYFYLEAKLELLLEGTLVLSNGPDDDICHLLGTVSQKLIDPQWSTDCQNFGQVEADVFIQKYATSHPINISVFSGASQSAAIDSGLEKLGTPSSDGRVSPGVIDERTDFYIKSLKTQPGFCQVPTPSPGP